MEMIKCIQLEKEFAGRSLFTIQQLSLQAGQLWIEEKYLFDFPQLGMTFGDKLTLVGSNGCGKTSFVRQLISKELEGYYNPKLKIAYFSQDLTSLNEEETAFVNASSTSLQDRVTVLNLLGMLGLSYDDDFLEKIHELICYNRVS